MTDRDIADGIGISHVRFGNDAADKIARAAAYRVEVAQKCVDHNHREIERASLIHKYAMAIARTQIEKAALEDKATRLRKVAPRSRLERAVVSSGHSFAAQRRLRTFRCVR